MSSDNVHPNHVLDTPFDNPPISLGSPHEQEQNDVHSSSQGVDYDSQSSSSCSIDNNPHNHEKRDGSVIDTSRPNEHSDSQSSISHTLSSFISPLGLHLHVGDTPSLSPALPPGVNVYDGGEFHLPLGDDVHPQESTQPLTPSKSHATSGAANGGTASSMHRRQPSLSKRAPHGSFPQVPSSPTPNTRSPRHGNATIPGDDRKSSEPLSRPPSTSAPAVFYPLVRFNASTVRLSKIDFLFESVPMVCQDLRVNYTLGQLEIDVIQPYHADPTDTIGTADAAAGTTAAAVAGSAPSVATNWFHTTPAANAPRGGGGGGGGDVRTPPLYRNDMQYYHRYKTQPYGCGGEQHPLDGASDRYGGKIPQTNQAGDQSMARKRHRYQRSTERSSQAPPPGGRPSRHSETGYPSSTQPQTQRQHAHSISPLDQQGPPSHSKGHRDSRSTQGQTIAAGHDPLVTTPRSTHSPNAQSAPHTPRPPSGTSPSGTAATAAEGSSQYVLTQEHQDDPWATDTPQRQPRHMPMTPHNVGAAARRTVTVKQLLASMPPKLQQRVYSHLRRSTPAPEDGISHQGGEVDVFPRSRSSLPPQPRTPTTPTRMASVGIGGGHDQPYASAYIAHPRRGRSASTSVALTGSGEQRYNPMVSYNDMPRTPRGHHIGSTYSTYQRQIHTHQQFLAADDQDAQPLVTSEQSMKLNKQQQPAIYPHQRQHLPILRGAHQPPSHIQPFIHAPPPPPPGASHASARRLSFHVTSPRSQYTQYTQMLPYHPIPIHLQNHQQQQQYRPPVPSVYGYPPGASIPSLHSPRSHTQQSRRSLRMSNGFPIHSGSSAVGGSVGHRESGGGGGGTTPILTIPPQFVQTTLVIPFTAISGVNFRISLTSPGEFTLALRRHAHHPLAWHLYSDIFLRFLILLSLVCFVVLSMPFLGSVCIVIMLWYIARNIWIDRKNYIELAQIDVFQALLQSSAVSFKFPAEALCDLVYLREVVHSSHDAVVFTRTTNNFAGGVPIHANHHPASSSFHADNIPPTYVDHPPRRPKEPPQAVFGGASVHMQQHPHTVAATSSNDIDPHTYQPAHPLGDIHVDLPLGPQVDDIPEWHAGIDGIDSPTSDVQVKRLPPDEHEHVSVGLESFHDDGDSDDDHDEHHSARSQDKNDGGNMPHNNSNSDVPGTIEHEDYLEDTPNKRFRLSTTHYRSTQSTVLPSPTTTTTTHLQNPSQQRTSPHSSSPTSSPSLARFHSVISSPFQSTGSDPDTSVITISEVEDSGTERDTSDASDENNSDDRSDGLLTPFHLSPHATLFTPPAFVSPSRGGQHFFPMRIEHNSSASPMLYSSHMARSAGGGGDGCGNGHHSSDSTRHINAGVSGGDDDRSDGMEIVQLSPDHSLHDADLHLFHTTSHYVPPVVTGKDGDGDDHNGRIEIENEANKTSANVAVDDNIIIPSPSHSPSVSASPAISTTDGTDDIVIPPSVQHTSTSSATTVPLAVPTSDEDSSSESPDAPPSSQKRSGTQLTLGQRRVTSLFFRGLLQVFFVITAICVVVAYLSFSYLIYPLCIWLYQYFRQRMQEIYQPDNSAELMERYQNSSVVVVDPHRDPHHHQYTLHKAKKSYLQRVLGIDPVLLRQRLLTTLKQRRYDVMRFILMVNAGVFLPPSIVGVTPSADAEARARRFDSKSFATRALIRCGQWLLQVIHTHHHRFPWLVSALVWFGHLLHIESLITLRSPRESDIPATTPTTHRDQPRPAHHDGWSTSLSYFDNTDKHFEREFPSRLPLYMAFPIPTVSFLFPNDAAIPSSIEPHLQQLLAWKNSNHDGCHDDGHGNDGNNGGLEHRFPSPHSSLPSIQHSYYDDGMLSPTSPSPQRTLSTNSTAAAGNVEDINIYVTNEGHSDSDDDDDDNDDGDNNNNKSHPHNTTDFSVHMQNSNVDPHPHPALNTTLPYIIHLVPRAIYPTTPLFDSVVYPFKRPFHPQNPHIVTLQPHLQPPPPPQYTADDDLITGGVSANRTFMSSHELHHTAFPSIADFRECEPPPPANPLPVIKTIQQTPFIRPQSVLVEPFQIPAFDLEGDMNDIHDDIGLAEGNDDYWNNLTLVDAPNGIDGHSYINSNSMLTPQPPGDAVNPWVWVYRHHRYAKSRRMLDAVADIMMIRENMNHTARKSPRGQGAEGDHMPTQSRTVAPLPPPHPAISIVSNGTTYAQKSPTSTHGHTRDKEKTAQLSVGPGEVPQDRGDAATRDSQHIREFYPAVPTTMATGTGTQSNARPHNDPLTTVNTMLPPHEFPRTPMWVDNIYVDSLCFYLLPACVYNSPRARYLSKYSLPVLYIYQALFGLFGSFIPMVFRGIQFITPYFTSEITTIIYLIQTALSPVTSFVQWVILPIIPTIFSILQAIFQLIQHYAHTILLPLSYFDRFTVRCIDAVQRYVRGLWYYHELVALREIYNQMVFLHGIVTLIVGSVTAVITSCMEIITMIVDLVGDAFSTLIDSIPPLFIHLHQLIGDLYYNYITYVFSTTNAATMTTATSTAAAAAAASSTTATTLSMTHIFSHFSQQVYNIAMKIYQIRTNVTQHKMMRDEAHDVMVTQQQQQQQQQHDWFHVDPMTVDAAVQLGIVPPTDDDVDVDVDIDLSEELTEQHLHAGTRLTRYASDQDDDDDDEEHEDEMVSDDDLNDQQDFHGGDEYDDIDVDGNSNDEEDEDIHHQHASQDHTIQRRAHAYFSS